MYSDYLELKTMDLQQIKLILDESCLIKTTNTPVRRPWLLSNKASVNRLVITNNEIHMNTSGSSKSDPLVYCQLYCPKISDLSFKK